MRQDKRNKNVRGAKNQEESKRKEEKRKKKYVQKEERREGKERIREEEERREKDRKIVIEEKRCEKKEKIREEEKKGTREEEMLCGSTLPCVVFEQGEHVLGWCVDHTVTHHTCVLRTWTHPKELSENRVAFFALD